MNLRRTPRAFVTSYLVGAGLALTVLYRSTLGGMGRDVGGEAVTTAFTLSCLYLWPLGFFLASRPFEHSRGRASLRRFGYVSAPLLFFGVAMQTPTSVWRRVGLEEVWFNYFGEAQIFTQGLKGVVYAILTAFILEWLRRRARPGTARASGS